MLLIICQGCDMDTMFLHPEPLAEDVKQQTIRDPVTGRSTTIHFGENFQPVFTNQSGDTLDPDYTIESVLFENSRQKLLHGWIVSPDSSFNGTTLFFLHGNAGNLISHFSNITPLVERGFEVFIFDYSGFGFSEGEASRNNVLEDAQAALRFISQQTEQRSTESLLIYGQSLGGHLAITVAARNEKMIEGLIVEGAYSSADDIASTAAGWLGRALVNEQYSGLESIEDYHKPLLVIHSRSDQTVPFAHGRRIFRAAGEPKSFLKIDRCHICGTTYYPDAITARIEKMTGTYMD